MNIFPQIKQWFIWIDRRVCNQMIPGSNPGDDLAQSQLPVLILMMTCEVFYMFQV